MRHVQWIRCLTALAICGLVFGSATGDDKSKDKQESKPKAKLIQLGSVDGELIAVDESSEKLTIRVKELKEVWIPNYNPGPANINNRGVFGRLGYNQNQGTVGLQENTKEHNLVFSPDMKVRMMNVKPDNSKSKGAKKEKDPDQKLGGVAGKKESLAKGQMVRIFYGKSPDRLNQQIYAMLVFVVSDGK